LLAVVAALGLALSAGRTRVPLGAAVADTAFLAALVAVVWRTARGRYGDRGAGVAALALLLCAPVLGGVGGGGLPATLLLTGGLALLTRCLLDPTLQRAAAAGVCLGLAIAVLHVEGAAREEVLASVVGGALALVAWRAVTAEPREPRWRVLQGAAVSAALAGLVGAAALLGLDALPPFEPTEYARVWAAAAAAAPPAASRRGLLLLNALPLLGLAVAQRPRCTSRYVDGATLIALAVAIAVGVAVPTLLALLAAPWLALLAGAAAGRARPTLLRAAAVALIVQALSAALLWPDYPRAGDGWTPVPVTAQGPT
jgi:hypothetical protein